MPPVPPAPSAAQSVARRSLLAGIGEGLSVIRRSSYLSGMMFLAFVPTFFLLQYTGFLPVFARDVLDIGSTGLGLLMAINGIGAVVGSLAVAGSRWLTRRSDALLWATVLLALAVIAFAGAGVPLLAGLTIFFAGLLNAIYSALTNVHLQMGVDDRVRGRVLSVYFLSWGVQPLGTLPLGAAIDAYGAPLAIGVTALGGLALIAVTAVLFPVLRRSGGPDLQPSTL
jgi:predicted MFS family arabinose efflux permease